MSDRSYFRSSSFKMAALFMCLLGISAVLLAYFIYDAGKQSFLRETEAAIQSDIATIIDNVGFANTGDIASYIDQRAAHHTNPKYVFQDANGIILAGHLHNIPASVDRLKEGLLQFKIKEHGKTSVLAALLYTFPQGERLMVARDIGDIIQSYERLQLFSILIIIFMVMVVAISFFISWFVVSRINNAARTAKQIIKTGDLSQRIVVDSNWDDLSFLATTLNGLLDRIEELMQGIREVSDNIAHDLRTPVTRLKNQLESYKDQGIAKENVVQLVGEVDHILDVFNSLLRIANIEKGKRYQSFQQVALQSLLQDVIDYYEPLAQEHAIILQSHLSGLPDIQGDRDLLFQLFANLLDNALKFSSAGSNIILDTHVQSGRVRVRVIDEGMGISDSDKAHIFKRFYRSDKSRHMQGSGLGLSMVKAIADLHEAQIEILDNTPGVVVQIQFKIV